MLNLKSMNDGSNTYTTFSNAHRGSMPYVHQNVMLCSFNTLKLRRCSKKSRPRISRLIVWLGDNVPNIWMWQLLVMAVDIALMVSP